MVRLTERESELRLRALSLGRGVRCEADGSGPMVRISDKDPPASRLNHPMAAAIPSQQSQQCAHSISQGLRSVSTETGSNSPESTFTARDARQH